MTFFKVTLWLSTLAVAVVHGSRDIPRGWSLHRRADPDAFIPLKFALVQSNVHNLDTYLLDVADPSSPNYGQHWSPAKVAETFRPSAESVETVRSWLVNDSAIDPHKIQLSRNGDVIRLNITVAEAEDVLGTEYYVYRSGEEGHERLGCHQGYSLPERVSKHVEFVWPTTHLGRPATSLERRDGSVPTTPGFGRGSGLRKEIVQVSYVQCFVEDMIQSVPQASQLDAMGCDEAVTLDCLRDLYNFHYTPVSSTNTFGVGKSSNPTLSPGTRDTHVESLTVQRNLSVRYILRPISTCSSRHTHLLWWAPNRIWSA